MLTIAHLLGRQIAREQFERQASANDNTPVKETDRSDDMIHAALYARYSSDLQSAASIKDQFRICREHAEQAGWTVVDTYRDAAISGDSMILRLGIQALLEDARSSAFDVVVAEALDRMSRDQADVSALFKHLQFARVMIVTLSEGEINELHVGLKGTMNALFLKDLAAKTHRGLRGRVEKGRSGGGLCYGYNVVTTFDAAGEPVRGERTINDAEANVVRRVFQDFASGVSPRTIARRLNAEKFSCPSGKLWTDSTIRGQVKRGTGLINNELYIGRLVWNQLRYVKNPETGKRVSRINPREKWIITEVPELRIIDDELWQAVKDRQEELTAKYATVIEATRSAHANRLNGTHRPHHLLSGLLECGVCGDPYSMRGQDRYGCSNHVMNDNCSNSWGIRRTELEERVLVGLKDHLMAPEAADAAVRAWAEETNRLNRERSQCLKRGGTQGVRRHREENRRRRRRHPRWRLQRRAQGTAAQARSSKGGAERSPCNRASRTPGHPPERLRRLSPQGGTSRQSPWQARRARCGRFCDPGIDRRDRSDARRKARRTPSHATW